ncbi:ATP phosphoribosyltransferase regulatory subunit [Terrilactibacillus sp. S3-3]|nr:ATP phosphoribosyltransferase regulatory subunit [Terrilactibacillus sp. S3-3]
MAYTAALYRSQQKEGGHPSEFEQTGAELIGDATPFADAEVIALMITLLKRSGLESIRIAIGHVGIVNTLLFNIVKDKAQAGQLRKLLYGKNDVGFRAYAASLNLPAESLERLNRFLDSRRLGNKETLNYLRTVLPDSENTQPYYQDITELMRLLSYYNLIEEVGS